MTLHLLAMKMVIRILLFIGKRQIIGKIKGERYARNLLKDSDGKVIKDHWDNKGKC